MLASFSSPVSLPMATKCYFLLCEALVDFSYLSYHLLVFTSISKCVTLWPTGEGGKLPLQSLWGLFPGGFVSWESPGTSGWKTSKLNSSTSSLENIIWYFLQLHSWVLLLFVCLFVLSILLLLGLTMESRDLCTKGPHLGQGANNLLSFGGRNHERLPMLQFPFFPLFGGLQLIRREWEFSFVSRIPSSKSHCYYFLLWETLVDMQLQ